MIIRNYTILLKGHQLIAQGSALDKKSEWPTPCKGKSHVTTIVLLPFQGEYI